MQNRDFVPYSALDMVKSDIEKKNENLSIPLDGDEIDWAIEHYPEIFRREEKGVVRAENADKYLDDPEMFDLYFAQEISKEARKTLEEVC